MNFDRLPWQIKIELLSFLLDRGWGQAHVRINLGRY